MERKLKIQWVDWMKVMAMFFVVWGHCFPENLSAFIYAFNVPVFFMLSGFLTREREESNSFYPKLFVSLVLPYLLLAFIKGAGAIIKGWESGEWMLTVGGVLGGFHSIDGVQGCSNLWFVYSLIVLRLIHHWLAGNKRLLVISSLLGVCVMFVLNASYDMPKWAVANALLALPFFAVGHMLRPYIKGPHDDVFQQIKQLHPLLSVGAIVLLALIVYGVGLLNGSVDMYAGEYGNNVFLFLLGGLLGSLMVFLLVIRLDSIKSKAASLIAAGNIVILTFHRELLHEPLKMIRNSDMNGWLKDGSSAFASVLVLLCFVPICWLVIRYVPILVGGRKG